MISTLGLSRSEACEWIESGGERDEELFELAASVRSERTGRIITYSRKVFIPLTNLCRDTCAYCTFARNEDDPTAHTLTPEEVVAIAEAGSRAGCREALFSLGERPELRYPAYAQWLASHGYRSTIDYLAAMCNLVWERTRLVPHANPGTMDAAEIDALRQFSPSMGMMLESTSKRLLRAGEAHHGCPDKVPAARMRTLEAAGVAKVPFTTGILIGIGETTVERVDSLLAIRDSHHRHGHIQEVIIQNFRAKQDTRFAQWPEPDISDLTRTAAVARLIFGPEVNIQIPPNLTPDRYPELLRAGINDWGGISPVTLDHINPERAWPALQTLKRITEKAGFELRERLSVYPEYLTFGPGSVPAAGWDSLTDENGLVPKEKELW